DAGLGQSAGRTDDDVRLPQVEIALEQAIRQARVPRRTHRPASAERSPPASHGVGLLRTKDCGKSWRTTVPARNGARRSTTGAKGRVGGLSMDLRGARTLVTGATGGLGAAIARACAARGAKVVLTGRRPEPLAMLASELDAEMIVADLADRDEVDRV